MLLGNGAFCATLFGFYPPLTVVPVNILLCSIYNIHLHVYICTHVCTCVCECSTAVYANAARVVTLCQIPLRPSLFIYSLFTYTHKRSQILRSWQKRHYDFIFFIFIFFSTQFLFQRRGDPEERDRIAQLLLHAHTHTLTHLRVREHNTQDHNIIISYMKKPVSYEKRKKK